MRREMENIIKTETEYVFGRRVVSSRDCIDLSDEIYQRTRTQVNPNTLRRFFGLVKAPYSPSQSTLTILSKYCGFHSAEEVYHLKQKEIQGSRIEEKSLLYYFISLFQETPVSGNSDKTFLSLVKHTIRFLESNLSLTDKLQGLIAKTVNGQSFYFEQFVNIDNLNSYYDDGLRYYLNEKRTSDAVLFVNALKVFKYWLNDNPGKVLEHGKLMLKNKRTGLSDLYIDSRFYAARLYYAHAAQESTEELLIDIYKLHSTSVEQFKNDISFFYFEYILAEALILTGHYNDSLYYLEESQKRQNRTDSYKYIVSPENFKLLTAVAYYKMNFPGKSEQLFNDIKPSGFHSVSKKFSGIIYLSLANQLKRKNLKYTELIVSLIKETGFLRFQNGI
jgi:hypothetical protein